VNIFVVATFRAVAVNPVTVGAVNHRTQGTVVAFQGGHQYHTLFRARRGCSAESSPLGHLNAGMSLPAIFLANNFISHGAESDGSLFSGSVILPLSDILTELFFKSFPVVQSNRATEKSVDIAGQTTSPLHPPHPPVAVISVTVPVESFCFILLSVSAKSVTAPLGGVGTLADAIVRSCWGVSFFIIQ